MTPEYVLQWLGVGMVGVLLLVILAALALIIVAVVKLARRP